MIENYTTGTTQIGKYVSFNLYENNEKIDAYLNSRHISGDKDSKGRDKPFFNIVTSAVNIWYRATDIDRKNIEILTKKSGKTFEAFLLNLLVQDWMRREGFGQFLNDWGRSLVRYGSSVVKFVEKGDRLHCEVIPWNRLVIDTIDFNNGYKIEKLYLTVAQLRQRANYDREQVESLENALKSREDLAGNRKDNMSDYVELYEVHGEMPLSYLTGKEEDDDTYVQQMHVVSYVAKSDGTVDDFTLFKGKEARDPYMITHLIKEDGRATGIGAVEHLFQAQWMVNHSILSIKNVVDVTSKVIFQTSDPSFTGKNALTKIESGDIMVYKENNPLTQINNTSNDITALQNFANQWKAIGQEITSTPDSLMGNTAPSGTAWRQIEALQTEAHSLFEIMVENKGFYIEQMMKEYVIPFVKKSLSSKKEVSVILDQNNIERIDTMYIKSEAIRRANDKIVKQMLDNAGKKLEDMQVPEQPDIQAEMDTIQQSLSQAGAQRFLKPSEIDEKTWKEVFKDMDEDVIINVTGESVDIQNTVTTLTTVLKTIATNPAILQDKNAKLIFNKILGLTGSVSPLEITNSAPLNNS
jgi:hypothetical protein